MNTKFILEFGCNHNGKITNAKKMIDEAKKLNVWAVKFQKRDIELIPDEIKKIKRNDKNSFGKNYYEHRKALELDIEKLKDLKKYAEDKGLEFCLQCI